MAEKKKVVSKSTKTKKSVKIDPQANGTSQPGFAIEKLFLKDVSVEVPNSPEIFTQREAPQIAIELANSAKPLSDGYFEVALKITVTSKITDKTAFLIEVTQAGIFAVRNVPDENLEMLLAITCPNILFPYAREAISDLVVKAGFAPVLLNPINFEALYMQQKQEKVGNAVGTKN
ncbi:MAG: protein-export chaperone SecB [Candidatus Methylopumilus sp.]|nr:protein-export chaperone SecB [Candidatus Methylopumilus sp.]